MKPITTTFTNHVFKLAGGTDENDLPVEREVDGAQTTLASTWELTDEERTAVANGANIELCVWGEGHPPVSLIISGKA